MEQDDILLIIINRVFLEAVELRIGVLPSDNEDYYSVVFVTCQPLEVRANHLPYTASSKRRLPRPTRCQYFPPTSSI